MGKYIGDSFISTKSRFGFIKGELLKLIIITEEEVVFQKQDGSTHSLAIKNPALIDIGENSIRIFDPLCRETSLKETWLIRNSNKLFDTLKSTSYNDLEIFWKVREYLENNKALYLMGAFSDCDLKYKDGMIYDYGVKGDVVMKFNSYNIDSYKTDDKSYTNFCDPFNALQRFNYLLRYTNII